MLLPVREELQACITAKYTELWVQASDTASLKKAEVGGFFVQEVVELWNSLPLDVVEAKILWDHKGRPKTLMQQKVYKYTLNRQPLSW